MSEREYVVGVAVAPRDPGWTAEDEAALAELLGPDPRACEPPQTLAQELLPTLRSRAAGAGLLRQITAAEAMLAGLRVHAVLALEASSPAGPADREPGGLQPPTGGSLSFAFVDHTGVLHATATLDELTHHARAACPTHPTPPHPETGADCGCPILTTPADTPHYRPAPASTGSTRPATAPPAPRRARTKPPGPTSTTGRTPLPLIPRKLGTSL